MMRSLLMVVSSLLFAGQVFALDLVLPAPVGNITASQILQIPQGPYTQPCVTQCDAASGAITACTDANNACLCTPDLGAQLQACEQCMYEQVVIRNLKVPDIRVGSNAVMAAYAAACKDAVNATLAVPLTLPSFWPGSVNVQLNMPATVVLVGLGGMMGGSAIWILSNM